MARKAITRKPRPLAGAKAPADASVDGFLERLDHPLKPGIEAIRRIILGVSPKITEGIKWNAPSFRTADWFATTNLRAKDGAERLWLILHTGAKVKKTAPLTIPDPRGLLTWLAKDRALITFADEKDVRAKRAALAAIIRAWIAAL